MTSPFVPGPVLRIAGAPDGPLAGLTFAAKDLFDVAGHPTGGGNPDWARAHPSRRATPGRCSACSTPAPRWSARPSPTRSRSASSARTRSTARRSTRARPTACPAARRRAPPRPWPGAVRHRARHRHRRLGAGAGELLRPLRHPADPRPARSDRHDAAGAELRHHRLVRARRRRPSRASPRCCSASRPRRSCRRASCRRRRLRPRGRRDVRPRSSRWCAGCRAGEGRARGAAGAAGAVGLGARAAHAAVLRGLARPSRTGSIATTRACVQRGAQPGAGAP